MNPTASFADPEEGERKKLERFRGIAGYFGHLHGDMAREGVLPYRLTRLGAWASSRPHHVYYFLRKLDLSRYRLFIDLGSGDGVVACVAGLFTRSVGIEVDPGLCATASKAARELRLEDSVSFICGDYRDHHIQQGDCLYLYPERPLTPLEDLLQNWQGTVLVYGNHFPPERLVPFFHLKCGREQMTAYRNPPPATPRQEGK